MNVNVQSTDSGTLGEQGSLFIKNIVEQLVDLSRRNPSLNFRAAKSAIPLSGEPETILQRLGVSATTPLTKLIGAPPNLEQLKTLRRLFDRSRLLAEERGVQALHVAVGLLHWSDDKSGKSYNAPIGLMPVALERSGDAYSLKRVEGEEPEPNRALLELFRRHPSVNFAEDESTEEFRYSNVAASIAAALPRDAKATITHESYLGLFSYEKLVMVDDIEANAESILAHPVICALNGDPRPLALLQHGIESPTPPQLDQATVDPNRVYVTEADPSQQETLEALARGLSLVVQGPPGTGKSQTIVNVIAQAMYDGKSVLFVAEKKVALDVVFDRLTQCGLGDGILAVQRDADKKRFAAMLGARHAELATLAAPRGSYKALGSALAELDAYRRQLHEPIGASGMTPFELYGTQARNVGETPPVRIEHAEAFDRDGREQLAESVERLAAQPSWLRHPDEATWSSLRLDVSDLGLIHASLDDMVEGEKCAVEIGSVLSEAASIIGPPEDTDEMGLDRLEQWLLLVADSPIVPHHWLSAGPADTAAVLERYIHEHAMYEEDCTSLLSVYKPELFESDLDRLAERFMGDYERFWKRWFNRAYTADVNEVLKKRLDGHRKVVYREVRHELNLLRSTKAKREAWSKEDHEVRLAFGTLFGGVEKPPTVLMSALQWFRRFAEVRGEGIINPALSATLTDAAASPRERARALAERLHVARLGIASCESSLQELFHDLPSSRLAWAEYLLTKIRAMEEAPRYCQYRKWISDLRTSGCSRLLDAIRDSENIEPDSWRNIFDRVFDASLIDYAHRTRPDLAAFDRDAHERLRERFAAMDEANVSSGGQRVARRLVEIARQRMGDEKYHEAIELVMREARKSRNVMPIRTLTSRAFDAIRVLKPCWMMSPLAVSQYLPAGQVFDLVIFDEASQMRPADAVPALSRAKQVVVVGDDKQLPPTSFFDNAIAIDSEGEPEEERPDLADYESILDRCGSVLEQRMLRWHYRSRDESLIAFSNEQFYDGRLVTFPTPARRDGFGVRFVRSNSTYARGGTRQNRGEADDVARLACEHARTRPNETLGIIAFSQAQQRAIEDALERVAEGDESVASFFADSRPAHERVFVKNLESVQGDERDVVILSIGYGRDDEGKLSYNFGPLNRAGGGRRLNVAVTRAKNELIVVSSIDDRDLDAEKCREGGPYMVRSYLAYARAGGSLRGAAKITGRGVDSPFEEDVRLVLANAGYKVHLQVGASGYRIDLAVCHPERTGEYVLAVECDGATYHGTPTARARDRLRDRTLRSFGWRIHRIWSRDWFRRRRDEISRLLHAVESALVDVDCSLQARASVASEIAVDAKVERDDKARMMDTAMFAVYGYLDREANERTKKDIADGTSLPESLIGSVLDVLIEQQFVTRSGVGRGTKYRSSGRRP